MMNLDEAYQTLKEMNLCRSQYQFSREFLKRDRSYYSMIKATKRVPTQAVLKNLHSEMESRMATISKSKSVIHKNIELETQENAVVA